jgi:uncharacterized LabA/DUF88 family protein
MRKTSEGRKGNERFEANKTAAKNRWSLQFQAQVAAANISIEQANATVEQHKLLILVDVQGMFLSLHKWLSDRNFAIDDGLILSRFAYLQIRGAVQEITDRIARSRPALTKDYNKLVQSAKVKFVDEQAYLTERLEVPEGATYLDVHPSFELFYAPAPLEYIKFNLERRAKEGSLEAKRQLEQLKDGVVERKGAFVRDYSSYDDFVKCLQENAEHSRTEAGFFTVYAGPNGLKTFDEKEVDTRIVMRAMDTFYKKEADSICIVSADQDFVPIHDRAAEFGILTFQADLKNFAEGDNVGRKLKDLKGKFIKGYFDREWPMSILSEAISQAGHAQQYLVSHAELRTLCDLHNSLNVDLRFQLAAMPDGSLKMTKL